MNILEQFNQHLLVNSLVSQSDRVMLAVSGGKDSMLMAWLFIKLGYVVEIAHCNFNLRAAESDGDEALVRAFAAEYGIPIHVKHFDTKKYAEDNRMSIQLAARELRYSWFEELRKHRDFDYIAIAQHKNDHVETVLFNLSRGTGLKGLLGIQARRDKIIRPLLFLTSKDVARIVQENSISYRDDSSNFSNKYARNKIRLDIIPEFEQLNPDFIEVMDANINRIQESVDVLDDFVNELRTQIFVVSNVDTWAINKERIKTMKIGLLYLLFEPFQFSKPVLEDLLLSLPKDSGRLFESENYTLLADRTQLILKRKNVEIKAYRVNSLDDQCFQWGNTSFTIAASEDCSIDIEKNSAKVDFHKLVLPLTIRTWEEGDIFQPLGMRGKKKLSDLFIQKKVNIFDKKEIPIVVNGNGDIIWVVGYQLDDRYKIAQNTKKVLKLVIQKI